MGVERDLERRPPRSAMLLSGLVYPGVGQLVQKRWLAGALFGGIFTVLFCALLIESVRVIIAFYELGIEGRAPGRLPSLWGIAAFFGASMVWYLINLADAYAAHKRLSRRSTLQTHLQGVLSDEEIDVLKNTGDKR